jgi:hypothetical protein
MQSQMQAEIKAQLMAEAREQEWSAKNPTPQWKEKFEVFGDLRTRYDGTFFPDGNDNTGAFPNFNAINTGAPFDVSGTQFSPQLNVDQDRHRFRFRFRAGAGFDLEDGFSGGFRVATGDSNSPVSTNQSFGSNGGSFSKYQLWLDRAFLTYNFGDKTEADISIDLGRFNNPFFASEVMWDDDIGLDGIAVRGSHEFREGVKFFATGGAWLVACSRCLPILPEAVACLAGLNRMPFRTFLLAVLCGSLPMGFVFAAIGALGQDEPAWALALSVVVPALLWLGARRWMRR